jgi:hypothetical protein
MFLSIWPAQHIAPAFLFWRVRFAPSLALLWVSHVGRWPASAASSPLKQDERHCDQAHHERQHHAERGRRRLYRWFVSVSGAGSKGEQPMIYIGRDALLLTGLTGTNVPNRRVGAPRRHAEDVNDHRRQMPRATRFLGAYFPPRLEAAVPDVSPFLRSVPAVESGPFAWPRSSPLAPQLGLPRLSVVLDCASSVLHFTEAALNIGGR